MGACVGDDDERIGFGRFRWRFSLGCGLWAVDWGGGLRIGGIMYGCCVGLQGRVRRDRCSSLGEPGWATGDGGVEKGKGKGKGKGRRKKIG